MITTEEAGPGRAALANAVGLLGRVDDEWALVLGAPTGPDWYSLEQALGHVESWFPMLAEKEGDRRAAASYLAGWLAEVPVLVLGLPAVFGGVAVQVSRDGLHVRRHRGGWFDRHALEPDDARTGPLDDVLAEAGAHVAALTAPIVDRVCAAMPISRTAVWGTVADAIGGHALAVARTLGIDEVETWRRCSLVVDAVQPHAESLRTRARLFPVVWSQGTSHFQVRGTCCLAYRTCQKPNRDLDGYCTTCPLRTERSRTERLLRVLESSVAEESAAGGGAA